MTEQFFLTLLICLVLILQILMLFRPSQRLILDIKDAPKELVPFLESLLKALSELSTDIQTHREQISKHIDDQSKSLDQSLQNLRDELKKEQSSRIEEDEKQLERYKKFAEFVQGGLKEVAEKINSLDITISEIGAFVADQKKQFRRYQDGYDLKILKDFLVPIFRLIDEHELEKGDSSSISPLREVLKDLDVLLENNGINMYKPDIGSSLDEVASKCEVVDTELVTDESLYGSIKSVQSLGYTYSTGEGDNEILLRRAKVVVFANQEQE